MLKWFRVYNKFILVVGGCLLMVAFLIQPVIGMFMPSPLDQPLGTLEGREITLGDQQIAGREISLAQQTHQLIAMVTPEEPLQWILMKHEAQTLGISASGYEVNELLTNLGITEPMLVDHAKARGASVLEIKKALRVWLTIQNYKELLLGSSHTSPVQKIRAMSQTQQMFKNILDQAKGRQQQQMRQMYMRYYYQRLSEIQSGAARVSKPLVEHFINDQQSRVKIGLLQIPASGYLDKVALKTQNSDAPKVVTEDELIQLFNEYKDKLPGASKPYGFGYRLPERVKLEYLSLPADRLTPLAKVSESDAVAFYDQNPSYFTEPVPLKETKDAKNKDAVGDKKDKEPTTRLKPYVDVRDSIITHLKQQKAQELGDKIIKAAQIILLNDSRKLAVDKGYRVVPEDYKALTFEQVAQEIQKQFDVLPDVIVLDKQWLDKSDVAALPGISSSTILGKARVTFTDYVFSVREIERETPHPQAGLRLQTHVVSLPLAGRDGSRYLMRVLDAQAQRTPDTLDEVRDTVVKDAKALAAFSLLLADRETWRKRLVSESLQTIATQLGEKVQEPPAFQRRQMGVGTDSVPDVQGVGRDEQFVDGVFSFAMNIAGDDPSQLKKMGPDKRSAVVAAPTKLSLYLVRVDEVHPVTMKQYTQRFASADALENIGAAIQNTLISKDIASPFKLKVLSKRVGFVSESKLRDDQSDE